MLETPKALSTNSFYIISENLKDITMGNQQETKVLCYSGLIVDQKNSFFLLFNLIKKKVMN